MLLFFLFGLEESKVITRRHIDDAIARLPEKDEDLERILLEIRYALCFEGRLTEVLADDLLPERALRQLLFTLEVEIVSRLTGEPKRLLPFDLGTFRGASAARH